MKSALIRKLVGRHAAHRSLLPLPLGPLLLAGGALLLISSAGRKMMAGAARTLTDVAGGDRTQPPADRPTTSQTGAATQAPAAKTPAASQPTVEAPATTAAGALADDAQPADVSLVDELTRIEGIGPKIRDHLIASGVRTFAHLAAQSESDLRGVLDGAGRRFNLADPTTWPAQAALAAAGHWEELDRMQAELKGGRA